MNRRKLLQLMGASGLYLNAFSSYSYADLAAPERYWVFFSAEGGWDTTLLCDPKGNINPTGKGFINHYDVGDIQSYGNINFAPSRDELSGEVYSRFLSNYAPELLVINGIDMETNNHPIGAAKIWSGDGAQSYPCLAALIAACHGNKLPLAFLSNGYYDGTAGIIPKTRATRLSLLYNLATPNRVAKSNPQTFFHPDIDNMLTAAENLHLQDKLIQSSLQLKRKQIETLLNARNASNDISRILTKLPSEFSTNTLFRQAQIACAAFSAGIGVCANMNLGGFDTHDNHDERANLKNTELLLGIEFLIQEAERQGIRDKLNIVIGSDFGRRPFYNHERGKDHWPIGSMMFIGPDFEGNKVISGTTNSLTAEKVNPITLAADEDGKVLNYRDIQAALRDLAGIAEHPLAQAYPISTDVVHLFSQNNS